VTWFEVDEAGVEAMLRSPDMIAAMERKANRGKVYAERLARRKAWRTGRYATGEPIPPGEELAEGEPGGGFHVWAGIRYGRAWARLYNPTPYARYLEWGTRRGMKPRRILGAAMDAMR